MLAEPLQKLEICVDNAVHVSSEQAPRKLIAAIRRQLRQHSGLPTTASRLPDVNLIQEHNGRYRFPSALLPWLTELCRRHQIPYTVLDTRNASTCPTLRLSRELQPRQHEAVRRLLLHDHGILVAPSVDDRISVAASLATRRQQHLLYISPTTASCQAFATALGDLFIPITADADPTITRPLIVGGTYSEIAARPMEDIARFGLLIFDRIDLIDPVTLMRVIRGFGPRYTLGLSATKTREDALEGPLFLALGGIRAELPAATVEASPLKLSLRQRCTFFSFNYRGRSDYQTLLSALCTNAARNQQIARDIVDEVNAKHACLVLSERKEQLELLAQAMPRNLRWAKLDSSVRPAERRNALIKFERGELDILFVSGQIVADNADIPRATRLFICFPVTYAKKLEHVATGLLKTAHPKEDAAIYDYDDLHVAPLHRAFEERFKVFAKVQRDAQDRYMNWAQLNLTF